MALVICEDFSESNGLGQQKHRETHQNIQNNPRSCSRLDIYKHCIFQPLQLSCPQVSKHSPSILRLKVMWDGCTQFAPSGKELEEMLKQAGTKFSKRIPFSHCVHLPPKTINPHVASLFIPPHVPCFAQLIWFALKVKRKKCLQPEGHANALWRLEKQLREALLQDARDSFAARSYLSNFWPKGFGMFQVAKFFFEVFQYLNILKHLETKQTTSFLKNNSLRR